MLGRVVFVLSSDVFDGLHHELTIINGRRLRCKMSKHSFLIFQFDRSFIKLQ